MSATDDPNDKDDDELFEYPPEAAICPYCGKEDSCEHLLLTVDRTFGAATGPLSEGFEDLWGTICNENCEDDCFNTGEVFLNLLWYPEALSDAECNLESDCGPGNSSSYTSYYLENTKAKEGVVARWNSKEQKLQVLEELRKCAALD